MSQYNSRLLSAISTERERESEAHRVRLFIYNFIDYDPRSSVTLCPPSRPQAHLLLLFVSQRSTDKRPNTVRSRRRRRTNKNSWINSWLSSSVDSFVATLSDILGSNFTPSSAKWFMCRFSWATNQEQLQLVLRDDRPSKTQIFAISGNFASVRQVCRINRPQHSKIAISSSWIYHCAQRLTNVPSFYSTPGHIKWSRPLFSRHLTPVCPASHQAKVTDQMLD